ncbi:hypothetical protein ACQY0O_000876 [Thecaphora frezii]
MAWSPVTMSQFWNEPAEKAHAHADGSLYGQSGPGLPLHYNFNGPPLGGTGRPGPPFAYASKQHQQYHQQQYHQSRQQQQQQQHSYNISSNYDYRIDNQALDAAVIAGPAAVVKPDASVGVCAANVSDWVFDNASELSHGQAAPPPAPVMDTYSGSATNSRSSTATARSTGAAPSPGHVGSTVFAGAESHSFLPNTGAELSPASFPIAQGLPGVPIPYSQSMPKANLAAPILATSSGLPAEATRQSIDVSIDTGSASASQFGAHSAGGAEMTGSEPPFPASSASPGSSNSRLGSSPESNSRPRGLVYASLQSPVAPVNVDAWMASSMDFPPASLASASSSTDLAMAHARAPSMHHPSLALASIIGPSRPHRPHQHPSLHPQQQHHYHQPSLQYQAQHQTQQQQFKTSAERRERNKASQRESRKRRQDRLEMLEAENVALRKALASAKNARAEQGGSSRFSGSIFLDDIEPHLEDASAEQGFNELMGPRFPEQKSEAWEIVNELDLYDPRPKAEDDAKEESTTTTTTSTTGAFGDAASESHGELVAGSGGPIRNTRGPKKRNVWDLCMNHRVASKSFTSLIVVPELVLYKVCRLYFSIVLPFTTSLKSGICNLRAARAAPFTLGGPDELPRFKRDGPGDESKPELVLPQNLMPTENQLRVGFHPVEIAVIPFPSMRDKLLTILEAFHSLEGIETVREGARITDEERAHPPSSTLADAPMNKMQQRTAVISDMSTWTPADEPDPKNAIVMPDRNRIYKYGFTEKPKGSPKMGRPAQQFLDDFFLEVVRSLRIWTPAGDVFDQEGFELRESFFEKYPSLVDEKILRATNRWRRARGESPIRL